jgi:hypothetical protein
LRIGALKILDQREFENFQVGCLPNDGGRLGQTDFLGRAPAAFAGNELKATVDRPDDQRLDDAALPDGIDQLFQGLALKFPAWLERARHDVGEADLLHFLAGFWIERRPGGRGAD